VKAKKTPLECLPFYSDLSLTDIAGRIYAHLVRFENAPVIPYYHVDAYRSANRLAITYVGYQHTYKIAKADALYYLTRLDGGFVGRHHEALRERDGKKKAADE